MADIFNPPTPPVPLPANLRPTQPFLARRGEFQPTLGGGITVTLEGEMVRCTVTEVLGPDHIVVEITSITTGKAPHAFRKGSILACQRSTSDLTEIWVPIDERSVREQEAVEKVRQQIAAEQTRRAAEQRGIDLKTEPQPEVEVSAVAGDIGSLAGTAPPVPHGTKVLGPRRSKVARAG